MGQRTYRPRDDRKIGAVYPENRFTAPIFRAKANLRRKPAPHAARPASIDKNTKAGMTVLRYHLTLAPPRRAVAERTQPGYRPGSAAPGGRLCRTPGMAPAPGAEKPMEAHGLLGPPGGTSAAARDPASLRRRRPATSRRRRRRRRALAIAQGGQRGPGRQGAPSRPNQPPRSRAAASSRGRTAGCGADGRRRELPPKPARRKRFAETGYLQRSHNNDWAGCNGAAITDRAGGRISRAQRR